MDAQKFGTFIAQCRKEKGMTQSELAAKIMVTDKAVSRWERGKGFPDINLLLPLAEALEVSVFELMHSERQKDMYCVYHNAFCYIFYKILWLWKYRRRNCCRCFYCVYSYRSLSPYQQQERYYREKNLRHIYSTGDLPDFSFINFFACKSTDPDMGNFLFAFPYYNCADSIMYFHADTCILKNIEYLEN